MDELIALFDKHQLFDKEITLNRNAYLKKAGSIDTNIYFIKAGSVKVFITNDGNEQIVRLGYKNNIIASLDSFLTQKPSDFTIQALKKTTLKVITKQQFQLFLEADTKHLQLWISILQDLVLQQIEREKDLLTLLPKERYQRVLERSPQLFQEIPNKHIANYLRMKPETLSRLKKH